MFLEFAITFVLDSLRKGLSIEQITEYMKNYAAAENNSQNTESRYNMIIDVLMSIFSGENPEVLWELIASYLGRELREKFMKNEENKLSREELLQTVIRNVDNVTLITALSGASGTICIHFLRSLSDRLLYFIHEDIQAVQAEYKVVLDAQRKVLELVKIS